MFFPQPDIGYTLQLLYPIGLGDGPRKTAEQMDMILDAANDDRRTLQLFGNAAEIGVEAITHGLIAQPWPAFLGRKDQMNVNSGEGLRHKRAGD